MRVEAEAETRVRLAAVVTHHRGGFRSGVARFNELLAERLGVPVYGLDEESSERCRVGDRPATLVLWAPDYDGGHKAWVRWDSGEDDIVPGSAVTRD